MTDPDTGLVAALVLVVHHVMADGLGGLAVLSALADPGRPTRSDEFPRPRPTFGDLVLAPRRVECEASRTSPPGCAREWPVCGSSVPAAGFPPWRGRRLSPAGPRGGDG